MSMSLKFGIKIKKRSVRMQCPQLSKVSRLQQIRLCSDTGETLERRCDENYLQCRLFFCDGIVCVKGHKDHVRVTHAICTSFNHRVSEAIHHVAARRMHSDEHGVSASAHESRDRVCPPPDIRGRSWWLSPWRRDL